MSDIPVLEHARPSETPSHITPRPFWERHGSRTRKQDDQDIFSHPREQLSRASCSSGIKNGCFQKKQPISFVKTVNPFTPFPCQVLF